MDEKQIQERLNSLFNITSEINVLIEKLSGRENLMNEKIQVLEKRLGDNDQITKGVFELSKNVAIYAKEVEHLTKTMDKRVTDIEERQQKQGERIGALEIKPAKRMELIITTIVTGIITLGLGLFVGHFI
jgi:predicted  nucleic acid-binding Zn-ribbon protein